jgi:Luciferase-like monooxygenase
VLPYSGADMSLPIDRVPEAERLGFDSVWTSEAYGSDAVTPAAWVPARTTRIQIGTAIMQMPARTPAMTAMTAMTSVGRIRAVGFGPLQALWANTSVGVTCHEDAL